MTFSLQRLALLLPLMSLVIGCQCGTRPVPDQLSSSFKMDRDSLAFPNFVTGYEQSVLDPESMRRMFGDGACMNGAASPCLLSSSGRAFMEDANNAMTGGRCEGFAVLAPLFEAKKLAVADFGGATARELTLEGNVPLQRELAYWFSTQLVASAAGEKTKKYMAREVMPVLADSLLEGATERYRIGIVRKKGNVVSGGHTLTPIGYYRDATNAGVYWVRVYDSNNPDFEKLLKIDTAANRWEFEAAENPKNGSRLYFGDEANNNPLYLAPIFSRQGTLPCPFCPEGGGQVIAQGGAQVVVDTPAGPVGLSDGTFVSSEGSSVTPSFSVEFDTEPASLVIGVSGSTMSGMNQVTAHITAPEDPENPDARQQVGVLSSTMRSTVSDLRVTANDTFSATRNGARYENASRTDLFITTEVPVGMGSLTVSARVNGGSNAVNTELDPATGTVRVGVGGAQGSEVVVVVTSTDMNGDEKSSQLTFVSNGDAGVVADGSQVATGGGLTGTVDNAGTMMMLTDACTDGVKSGMESDVDCGQVCTAKCELGNLCNAAADCVTQLCHATTGRCVDDACADARRSSGETDVDCGGTSCGPCANTFACGGDGDCTSGACRGNVCVSTFALGVAASGIPLGESLVLANGADALTVLGDGSFVFPARITGSYAVTITTQPQTATCTVMSGAGTASADVQVQVSCTRLFRVGGTLSGLTMGSVVLRNGTETLSLTGNGNFLFTTAVAGAYAVTVDTQPMGQLCTVTNGSGTAMAEVTNVTVVCSSGFTLGGTVGGLGAGKSVVLENGTEQLTVMANGAFTFLTGVMGAYAVNIFTQPMNQTCTLMNESGTATANVTNVTVTCVDTFSIGGSLSGLAGVEQAILLNNGSDFLPIFGNGAFAFATRVAGPYTITVNSAPAGKQCFVNNGTGTATADVGNVIVICTTSGTLDTTFNGTGSLVTSTSATSDLLVSAVINLDNTIVVAGQTAVTGSDNDMVVAKLNYNGTLDATFGAAGVVTISNGVALESARNVFRDGTGYLIVGTLRGTTSGNADVGIARLDATGALDTAFGTNGLTTHDLGGQVEYVEGAARDSLGRVLAVGRRSASGAGPHDVFVVRLNTDGTLDATFGTGGWFTWNGGGDESAQAVAVDFSSSDIVVLAGNGADTLVLKVLATGALWTGFGTGGVATLDLSGASRAEQPSSVVVSATDLYVVGRADGPSTSDLVFAKLDTFGALDPLFGTGGRLLIDRGSNEVGYALTPAPSGGWYVGGHSGNSMLIARVSVGGTIDTSFANGGFFESTFGSSALAYALLVDVTNQVMAFGTIRASGSEDLGVARINP